MKNIKDWLSILILFYACFRFISEFIFMQSIVPSASMENTLMIGERFICVRTYLCEEINYNDVVVFHPSPDEKEYWVKRVIGLPGDKIRIEHGDVYVNGEKKEENYISSFDDYTGSFTVPDNKYFVLGDNRGNSTDARYWDNPFISENLVKYKVILRVYPFSKIGIIN